MTYGPFRPQHVCVTCLISCPGISCLQTMTDIIHKRHVSQSLLSGVCPSNDLIYSVGGCHSSDWLNALRLCEEHLLSSNKNMIYDVFCFHDHMLHKAQKRDIQRMHTCSADQHSTVPSKSGGKLVWSGPSQMHCFAGGKEPLNACIHASYFRRSNLEWMGLPLPRMLISSCGLA